MLKKLKANAKYFCQMAENIDQHSLNVCYLKEKTMKQQTNPEELINMLQKELENYLINLRIRLLRNFVQNNKISEAYKHISDIEVKNLLKLSNNSKWYEIIEDIFTQYKSQPLGTLTWQFWFTFISILDKVLGLMLDENSDNFRESSHYIHKLFLLDQSLYEASQNIIDCSVKLLLNEFFNHFRGQLYFHLATIILKKAKNDLIKFEEAEAVIVPLLFSAYNSKPIDLRSSWIKLLLKNQKQFLKIWHLEGVFRCSQSGHILLTASQSEKFAFVQKPMKAWQERLFKNVFVSYEQQSKIDTSFFVNNQVEVNMVLPNALELLQFDRESLHLFPDSLHHYIWLFLHNESEELLRFSPFEALEYSVKDLSNCQANTLSLLDMEAFIYCATFCTKAHLNNRSCLYDIDKSKVLPVCITQQLGSVEQEKFLMAAYKICMNEQLSDLEETTLIVNQGLETVRCIGEHGIGVKLLVALADFFMGKAKKFNKRSEIDFINDRAILYWQSAIMLLEKLKTNQSAIPANSLFQYKTEELSSSEISMQIDRGKRFLCSPAIQRKQYEEALGIFQKLNGPYDRYCQAKIYKQIALDCLEQNKDNDMIEVKTLISDVIDEARNCLNSALHQLTDPSASYDRPKNCQLITKIDKLKNFLVELESDYFSINEWILMSESSSSSDGEEHRPLTENANRGLNISTLQYCSNNDSRKIWSSASSRSKGNKEPTFKRLDAQIELCAAKSINKSQVLEQNKIILESHETLVDEMRGFKDVVLDLSARVSELKTMECSHEVLKDIRKSVDELRHSVKDLQFVRNVSDLACQLRREIREMKKEDAQNRRGNDKYVRYKARNNVNLTPNLYQKYPNMIHQVSPPYAAVYPYGFYPALYGVTVPFGYPEMGWSQPGSLYGSEQSNIRALSTPSSQAYPLFSTQSQVTPQFLPVPFEPPPNSTSSSWNTAFLTGQSLSQTTWQSEGATVSSFPLTSAKSASIKVESSNSPPTLRSSFSQPLYFGSISPQHFEENSYQLKEFQIPVPNSTIPDTSAALKPDEALLMFDEPQKFSGLQEENTSTALPLISLCEIPSDISPEISTTMSTTFGEDSSWWREPDTKFQPVVSLPDIEVEAGEANAKVLFNCRARLFRFDDKNNEWKEIALGNMKILMEKSLVRLLMRRDQIHEICYNHQLLKNTKFQYLPTNSRTLTWRVQDFAEDVSKTETFAIRFEPEEQAGEFLRCISAVQADLCDNKSLSDEKTPEKKKVPSELNRGFGDTFLISEETWEMSNENKSNECEARKTPEASIQEFDQVSVSIKEESHLQPDSMIGLTLEAETERWECQSCLLKNEPVVMYCSSCKSPKNNPASNEYVSNVLSGAGGGAAPITSAFREADCAPKLGPSSPNLVSGSQLLGADPCGLVQKTSGTFLLESPYSLRCDLNAGCDINSSEREEAFDWSDVKGADDNLKRVIKKIEAESNQGNEEVLYCGKATLSELVIGEWRERSFGELMILRPEKQNGDIRVLMRRNLLLNIFLNHVLTSTLEYIPKDCRTWLFSAEDSSDGEVRYGQFCLSFENAASAEKFMSVVTQFLKIQKREKQSIDSDDGSEIELTAETSVATEDLNDAQRMSLPQKFFAYKQLPLCTCDQCARDDNYFKDTVLDERFSRDTAVLTTPSRQSYYSISSESEAFHTPGSFSEFPKYETPPIVTQSRTTPASNEKAIVRHTNTDNPVSSSTTTAGNLFGSKFVAVKNLLSTETAPSGDEFTAKYPEMSPASPSISFVETKPREIDGTQTNAANTFRSTSTVPKTSFGTTPSSHLLGISTPTSTSISSKCPPSKRETDVLASSSSTVNLFGEYSLTTTTAKHIFGSNTSTNASIFELSPIKSSVKGTSPITETNASTFGPFKATGRLFGSSTDSSSSTGAKFEFGTCVSSSTQPREETQRAETYVSSSTRKLGKKTSQLEESDEVFLDCNSDLSFASLAQNNQTATFQRPVEGGGDFLPFAFLGAGTPVFGFKNKHDIEVTLDHSLEEDNRGTSLDEGYDPHYEPIIPMPDAVVVSTGEEEETAVFNERAKLFRYHPDLMEWKERGVGQMKVLYHPENGTYRFLLRREQVHKIVLNQLITPNLSVQPMTTSDKACLWAGYNYVEDQLNLEKFAVRFKYRETSEKFLGIVKSCLSSLKEAQNLPCTQERLL